MRVTNPITIFKAPTIRVIMTLYLVVTVDLALVNVIVSCAQVVKSTKGFVVVSHN